jgi:hypothetical protein
LEIYKYKWTGGIGFAILLFDEEKGYLWVADPTSDSYEGSGVLYGHKEDKKRLMTTEKSLIKINQIPRDIIHYFFKAIFEPRVA